MEQKWDRVYQERRCDAPREVWATGTEELGGDDGAVGVGGDDDASEGVRIEGLSDRGDGGVTREWWGGDAGTDGEEFGDDDADVWVL